MSDALFDLLYILARNWIDAGLGHNCPRLNAIAERSRNPRIGDLVMETSHRWGADRVTTIGVLIREERRPLYTPEQWTEAGESGEPPTEQTWTLRTLDGREFTWWNASVRALPVCLNARREAGGHDIETLFRADAEGLSCGRVLPTVIELLAEVPNA